MTRCVCELLPGIAVSSCCICVRACVLVLSEPRSFYDKMEHSSNYGICGLLDETRFSTFLDKICGSCFNEKSVEN